MAQNRVKNRGGSSPCGSCATKQADVVGDAREQPVQVGDARRRSWDFRTVIRPPPASAAGGLAARVPCEPPPQSKRFHDLQWTDFNWASLRGPASQSKRFLVQLKLVQIEAKFGPIFITTKIRIQVHRSIGKN